MQLASVLTVDSTAGGFQPWRGRLGLLLLVTIRFRLRHQGFAACDRIYDGDRIAGDGKNFGAERAVWTLLRLAEET